MKLLFITPQLPFPARQGTTIRNYNLIRYLSKNHTIDLLSFAAPGEKLEASSPLHNHCRRIEVVSQPVRPTSQRIRDTFLSLLPDMGHRLESTEMRKRIEQWLSEADVDEWDWVQIEGIEVAQYGKQIIDGLRERFPHDVGKPTKLLFDNHNCEYLLQKRNALNDLWLPSRWPAALYSLLQWQKLVRYERQVCFWADEISAVSVADRDALQRLAPQKEFTVVYNGFDMASVSETDSAVESLREDGAREAMGPKILFIGKMDYRPNVDAMLWFGHAIFPSIQLQIPDATLQIVGMNPHHRLNILAGAKGIEIVGQVEDLAPYLAQAAVYVIPLRVGGGTRFKAIEAMAHRKPIVTTSLGIEGIPAINGEELIIADSPQPFSSAVLSLLEDWKTGGAVGKKLGERAHKLVTDKFTWPSIIPTLEAVYQKTVEST